MRRSLEMPYTCILSKPEMMWWRRRQGWKEGKSYIKRGLWAMHKNSNYLLHDAECFQWVKNISQIWSSSHVKMNTDFRGSCEKSTYLMQSKLGTKLNKSLFKCVNHHVTTSSKTSYNFSVPMGKIPKWKNILIQDSSLPGLTNLPLLNHRDSCGFSFSPLLVTTPQMWVPLEKNNWRHRWRS